MARTTYQVNGDKLVLASNIETPITLDTPEWFAWLLDCLPATLHLVIVTRADPTLPLARLET